MKKVVVRIVRGDATGEWNACWFWKFYTDDFFCFSQQNYTRKHSAKRGFERWLKRMEKLRKMDALFELEQKFNKKFERNCSSFPQAIEFKEES